MKNLRLKIPIFLIGLMTTVMSWAQTDISAFYNWEPLKIGGGGYVTGMTIHPTEQNLVYCRTDVGGAYRWDPANNIWKQLVTKSSMPSEIYNAPDFEDNGNVLGGGTARVRAYRTESIGVDPSDPDVLYMTSGVDINAIGFALKSNNRGETFKKINLPVQISGNAEKFRAADPRFAVDPNNSDIVYYGSRVNGLWRSANGGTSWAVVDPVQVPTIYPYDDVPRLDFENPVNAGGITGVVFDETSGTNANGLTNRIYISNEGTGIMKTENAGDTWTTILANQFADKIQIVNGVLYIGSTTTGLNKYTPAGGAVNISPSGQSNIREFAVDPNDEEVVYACNIFGFKQFYRTTDGGSNWTTLGTNTNSVSGRSNFISPEIPWKTSTTVTDYLSVGELSIDPFNSSELWFAEGMGMWRATDVSNTNNTPTFRDISFGIEEMVTSDIAVGTDGNVVVTAWDRIGFNYTGDFSEYPSAQIGLSQAFSSGVSLATWAQDPNVMVANIGDFRSTTIGVFSGMSFDGGSSWTKFPSISNDVPSPANKRYGEIEISSTDNTNLVWMPRNGEATLYYTTNQGSSWDLSSVPADYKQLTQGVITSRRALASDQVTGGKFYAYSWDPGRIMVSTDAGANWSLLPESLPSQAFRAKLIASQDASDKLYFATGADYRGDASVRGLHKSTDGGQSFTQIANIEECWALAQGKEAPGSSFKTVFFYGQMSGRGWGIYRSTDDGITWDKTVEHPLDIFDRINSLVGSPDVFGQVFAGFSGNSFAVGGITSTPNAVTGVTLGADEVSLFAGEFFTPSVRVDPYNAADKSITWSTSTPSIVEVDTEGKILALAQGTGQVTVTTNDGGISETLTVIVRPTIAVSSVTISPQLTVMSKGQRLQTSVEVAPAIAQNKTILYESSAPSIVKVFENGLITALEPGTASITARAPNGNVTDVLQVIVEDSGIETCGVIENTGFENGLDDKWDNSSGAGQIITSTEVISGAKAVQIGPAEGGVNTTTLYPTNGATSFMLSALVKVQGAPFAAVGYNLFDAGFEVIKSEFIQMSLPKWINYTKSYPIAADGAFIQLWSYKDTNAGIMLLDDACISLNDEPSSIKISPKSATLVPGTQLQLIGEVVPKVLPPSDPLVWQSSNSSVVSVDVNGLITAGVVGSADITYGTSSGSLSNTITVEVGSGTFVSATGVSLNTNSVNLLNAEQLQLVATVSPTNASVKSVTWTSLDPSIATVDDTGIVIGQNQTGSTTVRARTVDGGFIADAAVNVTFVPIDVTGFNIIENNLTLNPGDSYVLQSAITPSNASNLTVTWVSSNTSVATVTNGNITAIGLGSATITGTTEDGPFSDNVSLSVVPVDCNLTNNSFDSGISAWTLNGSGQSTSGGTLSLTGDGVGIEQNLSVNLNTGDEIRLILDAFITGSPAWAGIGMDFLDASGTEIGESFVQITNTTSAQQQINATAPAGIASVTVWAFKSGAAGSLEVEELCLRLFSTANNIPVTGIAVSGDLSTLNIGDTRSLSVAVSPSDASNQSVSWSSSNTGVATVSASGLVTAISAGSTTIRATSSDASIFDEVALSVSASGGCSASGTILFEKWTTGLTNSTTVASLTSSPNYPNNPDETSELTTFEIPTNTGDQFGVRLSGFICAPESGSYTFWIAGDDNVELWLSTDDNPSNATRIAFHTSWTNSRQWNKFLSTQKSSPVTLEQGNSYYVFALMREASGGDNLAVGWRKPSDTSGDLNLAAEVIPGSVLSPATGGGSGPTIPADPSGFSASATSPSTIDLSWSDNSSDESSFKIERRTGGGSFSQISTVGSNVTTFADSGLNASTTYTYRVRANNSAGDSQYTSEASATTDAISGSCSASGTITFEKYDGVTGKTISDLKADADFPGNPTSTSALTSMEIPINTGDNFGVRLSGFICAPETGTYFFFIAGDDHVELNLSTDNNPANATRIAYHMNWTNNLQWNKSGLVTQKSAAITLTAGESYYIEALLNEEFGGDNLAVGWRKPSDGNGNVAVEVIPSTVLSPSNGSGARVQRLSAFERRSSWKVFPTPSDNGKVNILTNETSAITIVAVTGTVHHQGMIYANQALSLNLASGLYVVKFGSGEKFAVRKIVVK